MLALVLVVLGVPIGAVVGAVIGAVIGSRRPKAAAVDDAAIVTPGEGAPPRLGGPPVEREASPLAALAVIGGIAIAFGAFSGGTLAVLRPAGAAPPLVVAIGTVLAAAAALWAYVDLLGVPSELQRQIFVGYWVSVAGAAVAAAGWFVQRRRIRRAAD
jgi:hypothetical protein